MFVSVCERCPHLVYINRGTKIRTFIFAEPQLWCGLQKNLSGHDVSLTFWFFLLTTTFRFYIIIVLHLKLRLQW